MDRDAIGDREDPEVIARGPPRMKSGGLQGRADDECWSVQPSVRHSVDQGCAGSGMDQSQQHPQRGRLLRAVRAQEAGDGSFFDLEAEVVYGGDGAELLCQSANRDGGHGIPVSFVDRSRCDWASRAELLMTTPREGVARRALRGY